MSLKNNLPGSFAYCIWMQYDLLYPANKTFRIFFNLRVRNFDEFRRVNTYNKKSKFFLSLRDRIYWLNHERLIFRLKRDKTKRIRHKLLDIKWKIQFPSWAQVIKSLGFISRSLLSENVVVWHFDTRRSIN